MTPTPQRQNVRVFPTASVADVLFWELKEVARVCPPGTSPPAYDTAHPNTTLYPNHKFCFIESADDQGLWQKWYYCASRSSQENYNGNITYPYGGATQYPRVTREYILRRDDSGPLELGTADPGGAIGGSTAEYLTPDGGHYYQPDGALYYLPAGQTPVLVAQSRKEIGGEIGSIFVAVTRVFDVIPGVDDDVDGSGASQVDGGYTIERPLGTESFLRLTWNLVLPRTIADANIQSDYTACPISGFSSLKLVSEQVKASDEENQTSSIVRVYEGNATGEAFPSTDQTRYHGKFYPGALPPEKFIISMRKAVDTTEILTPQDQIVETPTSAPVNPSTGDDAGGLLSVEVKPKDVLRGNKGVEYYTDLVLRTLSGTTWDDNIRAYVPYTSAAVTVAEAAALPAATIGTERTLTPVNSGWVVVTTESPVESTLGVTGSDGIPRSYKTTIPASWPRVLSSADLGSVYIRPSPGEAASSTAAEVFAQFEFKPEWSGLCVATVDIAWVKTAPAFTAIQSLDTTGVTLDWPGVVSLQIPQCLHGEIVFQGSTGSDHPRYGYVVYTKYWAPTTYTDWPDTLIREYSVQPYKGGYRVRRVTIEKPY